MFLQNCAHLNPQMDHTVLPLLLYEILLVEASRND